MKWDVIFYAKENGEEPANIFISKLSPKHKAKVLWEIDLLKIHGPSLTKPYVETIKGEKYKGLLELRIQQGNNISRILYFVPVDGKYILLHGFLKKTQKTPIRELDSALRYMHDYLRRFKNE